MSEEGDATRMVALGAITAGQIDALRERGVELVLMRPPADRVWRATCLACGSVCRCGSDGVWRHVQPMDHAAVPKVGTVKVDHG